MAAGTHWFCLFALTLAFRAFFFRATRVFLLLWL